jgi:hypothetical protein
LLSVREYLETGETSALLAGNAPFIVDKDTGEIHVFGTAHPLKEYLQNYEEQKKTKLDESRNQRWIHI